MPEISLQLEILSVISGIFPVTAAVFNYRHLDKVLKIAALFFLVSFLVDVILWIAEHAGAKNDMPVIYLYILLSIGFYAAIYYLIFLKRVFKIAALVLSGITLMVMLIFNHDPYAYPAIANTALSILLIVLSLIYFYQLLNPEKFVHIEKQSLFWINAGVLFYSAVNIFLFMLLNRIPVADQHNYYMIHSITNIIANLLYTVGLLCKPQKPTH